MKRTTFLDYNALRQPKTDFSCIKCQKDLDPTQPHRWVAMEPGSALVVHPHDRCAEDDVWPIGLDCAKKLERDAGTQGKAFVWSWAGSSLKV